MGIFIPNLYLKWMAVRELLKPPQSNAELATRIWGPDDGPSKFSKMLRGDYGCDPDVAEMLAEFVNKRLTAVRAVKGISEPAQHEFRGSDFELPLGAFTKHIVDAAKVFDDETLDRAHKALISEFTPKSAAEKGPRLVIEKFSATRFFEGVDSSEGNSPEFEIGRHKGLFAIDGVGADILRRSIKLYAMFTRDPMSTGARFWDDSFSQVVRWLPSPFEPYINDDRILLMPEPKPVQPLAGRFHVSVIMVVEDKVIPRIDPRGEEPARRALDEEETARFLTNINRAIRSHPQAIALCAGEYFVRETRSE